MASKNSSAESDQLDRLNNMWSELSSLVFERIRQMDILSLEWEQWLDSVARLRVWLEEQELRLEKWTRLGHEISIRHAAKECQALRDNLGSKADDLEILKCQAARLGNGQEDCVIVNDAPLFKSLEELGRRAVTLANRCKSTEEKIHEALRLWDAYNLTVVQMSQVIAEAQHALELNERGASGGDLTNFRIRILHLLEVRGEFDQRFGHIQELDIIVAQLKLLSEPLIIRHLIDSLTDLRQRWQSTSEALRLRTQKLQEVSTAWERYEAVFQNSFDWVNLKCESVERLSHTPIPEKTSALIGISQRLLVETTNYQQQVTKLAEQRVSSGLDNQLDEHSRQTLLQREAALQQRLEECSSLAEQFLKELQRNDSYARRFLEIAERLESFLEITVRNELDKPDPSATENFETLQDRLQNLDDLIQQFIVRQMDFESLQNIGFRFPIFEDERMRLDHICETWQSLYGQAIERCKKVQGNVVQQKDFVDKCNEWHAFLELSEHDLTVPLVAITNYEELCKQQSLFEKFSAQLASKQQILFALFDEGRDLLKHIGNSEKIAFKRKLDTLVNQWKEVIRKTNQRKSLVDKGVHQWQSYRSMSEKLNKWLFESEEKLVAYDFSVTSMPKVHLLLEQLKTLQQEARLREDVLHECQACAIQLAEAAGVNSGAMVHLEQYKMAERWRQLLNKLQKHEQRLEDVNRLWQDTDTSIQDVLKWFQEIRKFANGEIPLTYDNLCQELQKSKDFLTTFKACKGARVSLHEKEARLCQVISAEDIRIVHERIVLMDKQWEELCYQLKCKEQCIRNHMNEWNAFNNRYAEFNQWLTEMERKICLEKNFHIEDFIDKLQNEYICELNAMISHKEELEVECDRLRAVSSQVRADDLDHRLNQLRSRWSNLLENADTRLNRLQDTMTAVKQLELNMTKLRCWLTQTEQFLSSPLIFQHCDFNEIQRKMTSQQELLKDVETRGTGIQAVLNLCEVLLLDSDACPSESEATAIRRAKGSLEQRWKSICSRTKERRSIIDETWRVWQRIKENIRRMDQWLEGMEQLITTARIKYKTADEDLHRYEIYQQQITEQIKHLDEINHQYRALARESRTDSNGYIKSQVEQINQRWDDLTARVANVIRRLKIILSLSKNLEQLRCTISVCLTEIVTWTTTLNDDNVTARKLECNHELKSLKQQLEFQLEKVDHMEQAGLCLMKNSEASDSTLLEDDFFQFQKASNALIQRVRTLLSSVSNNSESTMKAETTMNPLISSKPFLIQKSIFAAAQDLPKKSAGTASIDSTDTKILQQFDTVSISSEKTEELMKYDAFSGYGHKTDITSARLNSEAMVKTPNTSARNLLASDSLTVKTEKLNRLELCIQELETSVAELQPYLEQAETVLAVETPKGAPNQFQHSSYYIRLYQMCHDKVQHIRNLEDHIKSEAGLEQHMVSNSMIQLIVKRWERLIARATERDRQMQWPERSMNSSAQNTQQMHSHVGDNERFCHDLDKLLQWFSSAERLLSLHGVVSEIEIKSLSQLESNSQHLKDFLGQLETRKPILLSLQLCADSHMNEITEKRLQNASERWRLLYSGGRRWLERLRLCCGQNPELVDLVKQFRQVVELCRHKINRHEVTRQIDTDLRDTLLHVILWLDIIDLLLNCSATTVVQEHDGTLKVKNHLKDLRLQLLQLEVTIRDLMSQMQLYSQHQLSISDNGSSSVVGQLPAKTNVWSHSSNRYSNKSPALSEALHFERWTSGSSK